MLYWLLQTKQSSLRLSGSGYYILQFSSGNSVKAVPNRFLFVKIVFPVLKSFEVNNLRLAV